MTSTATNIQNINPFLIAIQNGSLPGSSLLFTLAKLVQLAINVDESLLRFEEARQPRD